MFYSHVALSFSLCTTQGIDFIEVVSGLCSETSEIEENIRSWLGLLLNQINITGSPVKHLERFIKGEEKILVKYRDMAQEYVRDLCMKLLQVQTCMSSLLCCYFE